MRKTVDPDKKIILDADVVIHFIKNGQIGLLHQIFPNKLYMLDIVFNEVFVGAIRTQVENLFKFKFIFELDFENDIIIMQEYARLKKKFGSGESACMAYCKYFKDVIASSNLKDIKSYCEENNIQFLTTMDFLVEAYSLKLLSESECDQFIYNVKSKGSKLPCNSIKEFLSSTVNK